MDLNANDVTVWALSRYGQPDSLSLYQERTCATLQALRSLHPKFSKLAMVSVHGVDRAPEDTKELGRLVEKHSYSREHLDDYLHLESDGRLGPETLSRIGFCLTYVSYYEDARSRMCPAQGALELTLRGRSAALEPSGQSVIELPTNTGGDLCSREMTRKLLLLLLQYWDCGIGGVSTHAYQQQFKAKSQSSYAGQWLYYLPFPALARCLPPDIRHEPFANGILIETTPHMPDANNPSDIAAGKRVRDVLDEFGLVNDATYAIEGWPPDQEESRYEQFISGAPADRKYTVQCINFDGYDPHRKVLLYAKLFRRLKRHPKAWGLRGWDGPVLNEAKRQVRAAAKAGGVPIEWHIGLEEPAHQVRQLLADYTDITEQQLRVIYTPLEQASGQSPR